jgi:hypothetical protein
VQVSGISLERAENHHSGLEVRAWVFAHLLLESEPEAGRRLAEMAALCCRLELSAKVMEAFHICHSDSLDWEGSSFGRPIPHWK